MGEIVSMHEAKTHLSKLIARASEGEEILITKAGKPVARLTYPAPKHHKRRLGTAKGEVWIADDFDEPVSGFPT